MTRSVSVVFFADAPQLPYVFMVFRPARRFFIAEQVFKADKRDLNPPQDGYLPVLEGFTEGKRSF